MHTMDDRPLMERVTLLAPEGSPMHRLLNQDALTGAEAIFENPAAGRLFVYRTAQPPRQWAIDPDLLTALVPDPEAHPDAAQRLLIALRDVAALDAFTLVVHAHGSRQVWRVTFALTGRGEQPLQMQRMSTIVAFPNRAPRG